MGTWGVAKAKAQFSEVLDRAETEGPQLVERRKQRFVLLTEQEFKTRAMSGKGTAEQPMTGKELWDFLRLPPEDGIDTDFPRVRGKVREVQF